MIVGGVMIVLTMWRIYFDMPRERATESLRAAFDEQLSVPFVWGYGNYLVFGAAAATGAGLAVAVDQVTGSSELEDWQAGAAITVPVAVYVAIVWLIHRRYKRSRLHPLVTPATILVILATTFTPQPVLSTGIVVAAMLTLGLVMGHAE